MADEIDQTRDDIPMAVGEGAQLPPGVGQGEIPYPRLEMVFGPHEGLAFEIRPGELVIGRLQNQVGIHLDDASVSRRHCLIQREGTRVSVQDLKSRNGTYINNRKISAGDDQVVQHLDLIKVGIYVFRVAMRPVTEQELAQRQTAKPGPSVQPPLQEIPSPEGPATAAPPDNPDQDEEDGLPAGGLEGGPPHRAMGSVDEPDELALVPFEPPVRRQEPAGSPILWIFLIICLMSGLLGVGYFLYSRRELPVPQPSPTPAPQAHDNESGLASPDQGVPIAVTDTELVETEALVDQITVLDPALKPEPTGDVNLKSFQAFLDIKTEPTSARISLGDQMLGNSPLKVPVTLIPGEEYVLSAEYTLHELQDRYQERVKFIADVRQEVVTFKVEAKIGVIHILRLPREVKFYMEGYYAFDKYRAHTVKLTEIIYGQPIYVPYGRYVIELREPTRVGDSQTFVDEIRYRREFEISEDRKALSLTLNERDLQFFPARIQSTPSGAVVLLDQEKIGETPFEGEIPLGRHEMTLRRDGYFDHVFELDMKTNTPFETKIQLKTSKVGDHIQKALKYRQAGAYEEAVAELVEALKAGGSDQERAQVHYLLGSSFFLKTDYQQALHYFEQAKSHPQYYLKGLVGMARTYEALGQKDPALTTLIEVMLKVEQDEEVKVEARALFQKLSPLKSVIYIASEPAGATIVVNNQELAQKTPAILADLSLGNYRIEVHKRGYKTEQIRKNLKISEFEPLIIKLTPENL